MTSARACRQCAGPLPNDGPEESCPACVTRTAPPEPSVLETRNTTHPDAAVVATAPTEPTRLRYFGDYELLGEIARGGMGVVYRARQTSLHRDVAIKMIRAGALASPEEVERFTREAEAAANLQHPNIVAIHEIGKHNGRHYFSMDLVAGRDLGALVKDGPLAPRVAARYVKVIAEAIHFAHQRGTLHRDLKPQNVLIDAADQPRITDFGLAKMVQGDSRLTHTGAVLGSPSYMPPEQAAGRHDEVGPVSDVYSLGAMLYELLTGRPPFRAATVTATLCQVLETEPAAPRRLKADIPPDLETICLKCLEKLPSARYPSARALAEELDRYLKGEPIQARPPGVVRKGWGWAARHPGTLAAAGATVMVALGLGVFYLFEENAFLRARQADPALSRVAGLRHAIVETWDAVTSAAFLAGIYLLLVVMGRARGLSVKEWFDPAKQARPMQPLGERVRAVIIAAGLVLTACGVGLMAVTIQAFVWEGESILPRLIAVYGSIYFGLAALTLGVRDYRRALYGPPSPQLTAEQVEPIRRAMEDFDVAAAVRSYRDAVPDAGAAEAREYAVRLAESLRPRHPGKYELPPLALAGLNWPRMGTCAALGAVIVGGLLVVIPPADPAGFLWQAAAGCLFAAGIGFGLRVKGFWKRVLLLVPSSVVGIVGGQYAPPLAEATARSIVPYVLGFVVGTILAMSGLARRGGGKV